MTFTHNQLASIPVVLSTPRFATYLQHCNNDRHAALRLYTWNLEISAAFIIPLHIYEVSVRNAVAEVIEHVHTGTWPWNQGFIRRLPNPNQPAYNPQKDLQRISSQQPTVGKVVAELKLAFWEKMFTERHDHRLWNGHLKRSFPNAPAEMTVFQLRSYLYNNVRTLRVLRNRIAHHEPIFSRSLADDYALLYTAVSWRNDVAAEWMNDLQKVTSLMNTKPAFP